MCPAELLLPVPPAIVAPPGMAIDATRAVLDWLAARWRREADLEARLIDARAACP